MGVVDGVEAETVRAGGGGLNVGCGPACAALGVRVSVVPEKTGKSSSRVYSRTSLPCGQRTCTTRLR